MAIGLKDGLGRQAEVAVFAGAGLAADALWTKIQSIDIERFAERRWEKSLETRGYLRIHVPLHRTYFSQPAPPIGAYFTTIPFFENPEITESRGAKYASHPIFSRNEPIRMWVNSDPKQVSIKFSYTVPHAATYVTKWLSTLGEEEKMNYSEVKRYLQDILYLDLWGGDRTVMDYLEYLKPDVPQQELAELITVFSPTVYPTGDYDPKIEQFRSDVYDRVLLLLGPVPTNVDQFMHYTLNQIRSTVLGSGSSVATQAPPIVSLKYGTLYKNEKFIVKKYKFSIDSKVGACNRTLMPHQIGIQLDLESYTPDAEHSWIRLLEGVYV